MTTAERVAEILAKLPKPHRSDCPCSWCLQEHSANPRVQLARQPVRY